jgi:hypothetical protein
MITKDRSPTKDLRPTAFVPLTTCDDIWSSSEDAKRSGDTELYVNFQLSSTGECSVRVMTDRMVADPVVRLVSQLDHRLCASFIHELHSSNMTLTIDLQRLPCFTMQSVLALLLAGLASVGGAPYLLLSNKAPKCVSVEAAAETTLFVFYHAPGASSRNRQQS